MSAHIGGDEPEYIDIDQVLFGAATAGLTGILINEATAEGDNIAMRSSSQAVFEVGPPEGGSEPRELKGFSFSLDPFALVWRGLKVPVFGALDLTIGAAKKARWRLMTLAYQALPIGDVWRLSSMFDIANVDVWTTFDHGPADFVFCDLCSAWRHPAQPHVAKKGEPRPCVSFGLVRPGLPTFSKVPVMTTERDVYTFPEIEDGNFHHAFPQLPKALFQLVLSCECGDVDRLIDPPLEIVSTADRLGFVPPSKRHRSGLRCKGLRCVEHHVERLHGLHPVVDRCIREALCDGTVMPTKPARSILRCLFIWRSFLGRCEPGVYNLMAMSGERHSDEVWLQRSDPGILICHIGGDASRYRRLKGFDPDKHHVFEVPNLGSGRYLASWRYLLAATATGPFSFHILNHNVFNKFLAAAECDVRAAELPFMSCVPGNIWPVCMGNYFVPAGRSKSRLPDMIASFHALGWVYGWDEFYPAYHENNIVGVPEVNASPNFLAGAIDRQLVNPPTATFVSLARLRPSRRGLRSKVARAQLVAMRQIYSRPELPTIGGFFRAMFDPRAIVTRGNVDQPGFSPETVEWPERPMSDLADDSRGKPGMDIAEELSREHGGFVFCTFGSLGDVIPVLALVRHLRAIGVHAVVFKLNSDDEGKSIVQNMEQGKPMDLQLHMRAMEAAGGITGATLVVPRSLALVGDLVYDLAPPSDVIRRFTFTGPVWAQLADAILSFVVEPDFHIGAYLRPGWLPRSANGVSFLKPRISQPVVERAQVIGSGGHRPSDDPKVVVLQATDHEDEFTKVRVLMCSGSAGVVQTAAVSGARVEVTTDVLDRDYRNPYDAGAGVQAGSDPDAILLALGSAHWYTIGLWMRKNMFKPWKLLAWYGAGGLALMAYRIALLWYLVTRRVKVVGMSSDPLATLVGLILNAPLTWKTCLVMYMIARAMDELLSIVERDYFWLASVVARMAGLLVRNPVAVWAAQEWSMAHGLAALGILQVTRPVALHVATWGQRAMAYEGMQGPVVFMEVSLRLVYKVVPVWHTELVVPASRSRWAGITRPNGIYEFARSDIGNVSGFLIPTALTETDLKYGVRTRGSYGLHLNCHTAIWCSLEGHTMKLGLGGFLVGTTTLVAFVTAAITAAALAATALITSVVPETFGLTKTKALRLTVVRSNLWELGLGVLREPRLAITAVIRWWNTYLSPI